MEEFVTKAEYREFSRRVDEENNRQNIKISSLEKAVQEISRITISVERLAVSMENMKEEQKKTNDRLENIEAAPGKKWDLTVNTIITGIIGFLIGGGAAILGALATR